MPLSVSEIEHYGFWFDRDRYTIPYVTKHNLYNLFAGDTEEIIGAYFNNRSHDRYVFKPEYDTQRKLEDSFMRNGLLPKHADILDNPYNSYSINGVTASWGAAQGVKNINGIMIPARLYSELVKTGLCYRGV
jgi:hypothetical protein